MIKKATVGIYKDGTRDTASESSGEQPARHLACCKTVLMNTRTGCIDVGTASWSDHTDFYPRGTQPSARLTYYAFGEYDIVMISEAPDNVTVASIIIAAAGGAVGSVKTTPLMTAAEGMEAIKKAGAVAYPPPE